MKVLEGTVPDDSWFAFIAGADEGDDWTDPKVWRKANPSFGLSVKQDDLARKAEKAIALPGAQNAFRRMHLNEWTEQAERWIDLAAWTPARARSTLSSCAAGAASAGSTSRPRPMSPRSPGSSRPTTTTASGMCCRATSCPRTTPFRRARHFKALATGGTAGPSRWDR